MILTKSQKIALAIIFVGVIIGFADSSYLFYKSVTADPIHCFLLEGCNTVAGSPYSRILGVSLPTFGLIFYSTLFLLAFFFARMKSALTRRFLFLGTAVGFLFSLYFIYLQGFVIGAFCIYCLISALASTIDFCAAIYISQTSSDFHIGNSGNNHETAA